MNNKIRMLGLFLAVLTGMFLFVLSVALVEVLPLDIAVMLIVLGSVIFVMSIVFATFIEYNMGFYECKNCGNKFKPTYRQYLCGMHIGTTRRLKCPKCGIKTWCKMKTEEE